MRRYFYDKISNFLIPNIKNNGFNIKHNGTFYGGCDIVHRNDIKIVISCGLGEDASFEIELLKVYNCKIVMIDPTPRSNKHYTLIKKNFGKKISTTYKEHSGNQLISSYDLRAINKKTLCFSIGR